MNLYGLRNPLLIPALLCIALACGCTLPDGEGESADGIRTVEGAVVAIDLSEMAVDGPGVVRVKPEDGSALDVLVSACEGPCSRQANEALQSLKVGDRVRARGDHSDGDLVLYDDERHYLEVLE